ncbi:MAG: sugar nucleotide-binding protein [Caldilineales bacterium]|nr:sugar nucleotide-binding protein [Caldilineales bacterium]
MRVLITGASGYLGRHLLDALPADWETWAGYLRNAPAPRPTVQSITLDIADADDVRAVCQRIRPELIIHTAIAREPDRFEAVIVRGSAHIASAAAAIGAKLIHLSSDIVFDGTESRYDENTRPVPEPVPGQQDRLTAHGRAKARAEQAVRASHPDPIIVRTSLIYGFEPLDHATTWLVAGLKEGKPINLFTDQVRCPIYAPDLAASLVELAGLPFSGVINLVGPTAINRYNFGLLLCQALGLDPVPIMATPTPPENNSPRNLILDDALASSLLTVRPRSPEEVCHNAGRQP